MFDAVAVVLTDAAGRRLSQPAAAVSWVHDAFVHLKVLGHSAGAKMLLQPAGVRPDKGILELGGANIGQFAEVPAAGSVWSREPSLEDHSREKQLSLQSVRPFDKDQTIDHSQ